MAPSLTPIRTRPANHKLRCGLARALAGLVIVLALAAAWLFWPESPTPLRTEAHPAATYAEAVQQVEALATAARAPGLHPLCEPRFLTHGQRQPRAIVLVHGYTACPQQFAALGKQFFARGYNVVILPLPRHGLADTLTDTHSQLTAEEMAAHAGALVDLAQGLGEETTLLGLSGGAVVAGWAAQTRPDLDQAVLIAPGYGFRVVPTPLTRPAMRLYQVLPNEFRWWDPVLEAAHRPQHGYPRYATRALAQLLRLGEATRTAAGQQRPAAVRIVVVTNANDERVNNALTASLAAQWEQQGGNVVTFEFPAELGLPHDVIDPYPPHPQVPAVHARLVALEGE